MVSMRLHRSKWRQVQEGISNFYRRFWASPLLRPVLHGANTGRPSGEKGWWHQNL